jgi:hypothetical protein
VLPVLSIFDDGSASAGHSASPTSSIDGPSPNGRWTAPRAPLRMQPTNAFVPPRRTAPPPPPAPLPAGKRVSSRFFAAEAAKAADDDAPAETRAAGGSAAAALPSLAVDLRHVRSDAAEAAACMRRLDSFRRGAPAEAAAAASPPAVRGGKRAAAELLDAFAYRGPR